MVTVAWYTYSLLPNRRRVVVWHSCGHACVMLDVSRPAWPNASAGPIVECGSLMTQVYDQDCLCCCECLARDWPHKKEENAGVRWVYHQGWCLTNRRIPRPALPGGANRTDPWLEEEVHAILKG